MKKRYFIIWFTLLSYAALAQNNIKNRGDCNANIQGTGNDVTINCASGSSNTSDGADVRLVIASNNTPIVNGMINWQFVNPLQSSFTLEIDDDTIINQTMDDVFSDERLRLKKGEHFYTMEVSFVYVNGVSDSTTCSGIIDAQISASIVPRILISQNPQSGAISPINCGFTLR